MEGIKKSILEKLSGYFADAGFTDEQINLERPLDEKNGDYSTNVAMVMAKKIGRNPREIAEEIISQTHFSDIFERVEVAGGGFINFYLSKKALADNISEIIEKKSDYGKTQTNSDKKVVLEHTNVNPNKALHVGHLRNACLGSAIERILESSGYDVEVQNYIDDTGVQVAGTALGLRELSPTQMEGEKFDHFASRVYVQAMEKIEQDPDFKGKQAEIIHALDKHEGEIAVYVKDLAKKILIENLKSMHEFEIDYDLLVWESDIIGFDFWLAAFELLKKSDKFYKAEDGKNAGCYVIDDVMGDQKVIVKSNSVVTYTGKDIAYHLWKYNLLGKDFLYKKFEKTAQQKDLFTTDPDGEQSDKFGRADMVVNIVDVRQNFPQQAVKESLKALGYHDQSAKMNHVGYGVVNLSAKTAESLGVDTSSAQSSYAMSGRKGIGVLADSLLEEAIKLVKKNHPQTESAKQVALGAIKYYMLNYNPYSDIVFDFETALNIYGNSGPYIQYAHARCASLIQKASDRKEGEPTVDFNEAELSLAKHLERYCDVITASGENFSPNLLCNYLFELAKKFNAFYATCQIINESDEVFSSRMKLVRATKQILANGLGLLSISAPDKM